MEILERVNFDAFLAALREADYEVVGPTVRDNAIVYDFLSCSSDLPVGLTDEQDGGHYRVKENGAPTLFGYAVGPRSLKHYTNPPNRLLWRARGESTDFTVDVPDEAPPRYAFLGVRACELAALRIQDQVFLHGPYVDPYYKAVRDEALLVAVNCGHPSGTCFCVSMETGPGCTDGFDLLLTEVLDGDKHYFTIRSGSEKGAKLMRTFPVREATSAELRAAEEVVERTATAMGRSMSTNGIQELLYRNAESPLWDAVAERCMTCGNCTMACPTCFCSTVEDTTSLSGDEAERRRLWDSCFTMDFSYIHGGSARKASASRYRQWLTHKLAGWQDQFGSMGCVGCGRCITWCPVGIDITEEVAALQAGGEAARKGAQTP